MFSIRSVLALGVAATLVSGCGGTAVGPNKIDCQAPDREKEHKLEFKVKAEDCVDGVTKNGQPADDLNVCRDDTVKWKVTGKKKKVVFDKQPDSPFDWRDSDDSAPKPGEIEGKVRTNAVDKAYGYTVVTDLGGGQTCQLDPKIIVNP
jgi:hypothetical protein